MSDFFSGQNRLSKIAIYFNDLDIRDKKNNPSLEKNIEMHHCHHCCNYGTFFHHLVHPGLSASHGQDEEVGILNMSCCTMHTGANYDQKVKFQMDPRNADIH